ncbi:MAG: TetR/AcrR family transcriptional regulator [Microbacterium sp.]|uniref:TetR/AcrR family transcriptional regulator n=1 Tax=Microbacterium sp. TaxID=51671 RepID=UPI0039E3548A
MATTTTPVARTPRGERRRQQILDSAAVLFVEAGYRATSLRDIAAAVGISHPGLLRHFSSKDDVLRELVERLEAANESWFLAHERVDHPITAVDIARRNAEQPGYLALFSALAGEATTSTHPAHERMARRYAGMRSRAHGVAGAAGSFLPLGAGRTVADESVRLVAGWDGLQLLQLYLPDRVEVVRELERHQQLIARPYAWGIGTAAAAPGPIPVLRLDSAATPEPAGNTAGRARRERIVADAMALFAAEGYADTSMRTIAERVGVSKSSLFHHYPTKEDLLRAVLAARDDEISQRPLTPASSAAELLRDLPVGAAVNAERAPGLIEVYSVLSCEATAARHPAHDYFRARFDSALDAFRELFAAAARDGDLPAHRDPEHEAIWLVALWDGLQIQWLYDRDGIDVAAQLAAHLDDVLPRR